MPKRPILTALAVLSVLTLVASRTYANSVQTDSVAVKFSNRVNLQTTTEKTTPVRSQNSIMIDRNEEMVLIEEELYPMPVSVQKSNTVNADISPTRCITEEEDQTIQKIRKAVSTVSPTVEIEVEDELIWIENDNNSPFEVRSKELVRVY